jgi:hypothetical protein
MKTRYLLAVALVCTALLAAGSFVAPIAPRAQDAPAPPPPPTPTQPKTPWKGDPTRPEITGADAGTPAATAVQPPGQGERMAEAAKRADKVVALAHELNGRMAKTPTAQEYRDLGTVFERLALDLQATVTQLHAVRGASAGDASRDAATDALLDETMHMLKDAERMHGTIARAATP